MASLAASSAHRGARADTHSYLTGSLHALQTHDPSVNRSSGDCPLYCQLDGRISLALYSRAVERFWAEEQSVWDSVEHLRYSRAIARCRPGHTNVPPQPDTPAAPSIVD
eukprot:COSAG06_NODE_35224_length_462_cov_1.994490_1_plen_108_part_01